MAVNLTAPKFRRTTHVTPVHKCGSFVRPPLTLKQTKHRELHCTLHARLPGPQGIRIHVDVSFWSNRVVYIYVHVRVEFLFV